MAIQNFPQQLQPIIQQGFLAREFQDGLQSRLSFRAIADREVFPNRIGETITKTRKGLKTPVTVPLVTSSNTNFDNGLTPSTWSVEQYTRQTLVVVATPDGRGRLRWRVGVVRIGLCVAS